MTSFECLFEPINIGKMKLKNRIVLAPMATHYATENGHMTQRLIDYYLERTRGGVGLVVSESNYVSPEGRGGFYRLGLYDDHQIREHRKLTEAVHREGTPVCSQIHHGGTTVSMKAIGQHPLSCSAVPLLTRGELFVGNIPRQLAETEIMDVVNNFAQAAWRARESGFDAVMVHAAHGYLINQFLSPHTNKRSDKYGGSDENRARFLIEIAESIREILGPEFPIMVRVTGDELFDGGYGIEFIQKVATWLENAGIDEINVSAGNYEEMERMVAPPNFPEGFLVQNAAAIKEVVNIPVGVVGRIMGPEIAETIIKEGKADLLYLGRALIADPEFPAKIREGRETEIRPCIVCNKGCIDRLFAGLDITCSVNASLGREASNRIFPADTSRNVLVIGGGPAGLEAARVAALRGHQVTLYEKSGKLGGALNKAVLLPHKEPIASLIRYYTTQMALLRVQVTLKKEATPEVISAMKPDVIILAAGAEPFRLGLPGSNLPNVFLAEACMNDLDSLGNSVIIIGGGLLGAELAEALADHGKSPVLVEQLDSIAGDAGFIVKKELLKSLCSRGVKMLVGTKVVAISQNGIIVERLGEREILEGDSVVLAIGYRPKMGLVQHLDLRDTEFHQVGDIVAARTIMDAIEEGNRVGLLI
ncbi:MAG: FAD-dependent oxidoreductase [Desulfobacteraceae bacterium]|nr:FAD-dependent oxidoreductase [Desulfobacteraceae bacterium]